MAQSYKERDPVARAKLLHDAEAVLMQDQPIAPLMVNASLWLISPKVKGFVDNAVNDHLTRYCRCSEVRPSPLAGEGGMRSMTDEGRCP